MFLDFTCRQHSCPNALSKSHLVVFGFVLALVGCYFAPALGGSSSFAFRDAAHYYYPLFEFESAEWGAGQVPLWNPYENLGMRLAAENTSSVYYPGKLIFALGLDFPRAYGVYIAAHVALAAATSFLLARHWLASVGASGLGAMAYAFSGSVLFAYSNVVFLVGAAWLPYALLLADRMLKRRAIGAALGLGVVLALMILGGDPQMAYNVLLLTIVYAVLLRREVCQPDIPGAVEAQRTATSIRSPGVDTWYSRPVALVALAAATACLVAAVQILPTWQASRDSARGTYGSPRNVLELAGWCWAGGDSAEGPVTWHAGLLGASGDDHQRQIYQFSVGPWRAFEFLWPNAGGRLFPTHRRWLAALPAEGRVWAPSLYLGLLPFLLALSSWSLRRHRPANVRWMSWTLLLASLASLGEYGLGWAVGEVNQWCGGNARPDVGAEVGGLYWLMTVLLPYYIYFRYPAKLLVVASLAIAMLAVVGWDRVRSTGSTTLWRGLWVILVMSGMAAAGLALTWPNLSRLLRELPAGPLWGPFDVDGCWRDVAGALLHTSLMAIASLVIVWNCSWLVAHKQTIEEGGRHAARFRILAALAPFAALVATAVDLAVAQRWMMAYAPAAGWSTHSPRLTALAEAAHHGRIFRDFPWQPADWQRTSSKDRPAEIMRWERATWQPKYPLSLRASLVESSGTLVPYDYQMLMEVARAHGTPGHSLRLPHDSVLDLLGVRFSILPRIGSELMETDARGLADDAVVIERGTALPRAWIVHRAEALPPLITRTPSAIRRRTEEVLFPAANPRDWRRMAVLETDRELESLDGPTTSPVAKETCQIVAMSASRVDLDVRLQTAGLVVMSDYFDPDWTLTLEDETGVQLVEVLRANRVMRAAVVPAGSHHLVYRYRPRTFVIGAAVSVASALVLLAAALMARASCPCLARAGRRH